MRLLIAGGRSFKDYRLLCKVIKELNLDITEIVHGGANGADKLGELYATENNIPKVAFPADWDTHGKKAGYLRNLDMAAYLNPEEDMLLCFWDGISRGTKHMLYAAKRLKIQTHLHFYAS